MVYFSQRLRQLRNERRLTQEQVSQKIGVTASMVSSYETDIRLPSYEVLIRIASLFGVTIDYLLNEDNRRLIDISHLSNEEAAVICDMISLLQDKRNITT